MYLGWSNSIPCLFTKEKRRLAVAKDRYRSQESQRANFSWSDPAHCGLKATGAHPARALNNQSPGQTGVARKCFVLL